MSFYGTETSFGTDPAAIADPSDRSKVFAWKLTRTEDSFGNRIEYEYESDTGKEEAHHWDQLYLTKIRYVDYVDDQDHPQFLVTIEFIYEMRPDDPHSEYRSGFEIRTRKRCSRILVRTHAMEDQHVRTYDLIYLDQRTKRESPLPLNGVSLLSQVKVTGHDGGKTETLPPLEFSYTSLEPEKRDFVSLKGSGLPPRSLANPDLELVDLFGNGLPDLMEMNGAFGAYEHHRTIQSAVPLEATAEDKFQIEGAAVFEFDAATNQLIIKRRGGQERVLTKEK